MHRPGSGNRCWIFGSFHPIERRENGHRRDRGHIAANAMPTDLLSMSLNIRKSRRCRETDDFLPTRPIFGSRVNGNGLEAR